VVQGLTLRPLLLWLGLEDDGSVDREIRLARVETLRAAVAAAATCPGAESATLVRHRYELQLRRAEAGLTGDGASPNGARPAGDSDAAVVRAAMEAQRRRLAAHPAAGTIGDAAFQRNVGEHDWTALGWAQVVGPAQA
jgi:CPA1 family monovalent cation:H+ antiporter